MGICHSYKSKTLSPAVGGNIEESAVHPSVKLDNVHKYYRFKKVIGHGHFGTVRIASPLHGNTESEIAIKSVLKSLLRDDLYFLKRELEILMLVDHPNIIKYYESYEDDRYIHIVQELCSGGDLLDRFAYAGPLDEKSVAHLMEKIFSAVNHLHTLFICHRDIKPENFLFKSRDLDADVKLIDFGMSAKFGRNCVDMYTMVGTPNYLAPEVLNAKYGKECDVWSLGVMLYYTLSGFLPFVADTIGATFKKIADAEYDFSNPVWENFSAESKDLISKMLVAEPKNRIKLSAALTHRWFVDFVSRRSSLEVSHAVLASLKHYKPPAKLQREAMKVMVRHFTAHDIEELDSAFKALDKENTGFVTLQSIEKAMRRAGLSVPSSQLQEIVETIDGLQQEGVKYSNFLMATLDRKKFLNEEVLYMAFKHMDMDNDGFITPRDLKALMESANESLPASDLKTILSEFLLAEDDRISFEQFTRMMEDTEMVGPPASAATSGVMSRRSSVKQVMSAIAENFN